MNAKWMSGVIIAIASVFGLLATSCKATAADTLTLQSVKQVTVAGVPQVQGNGTYSTAGTLNSITMYVNDPNNVNVSTTPGTVDKIIMTNWSSISAANGGLTVGTQYTVYAVMKATTNGVQNMTTSTPLAITIVNAGGG